MKMKSCQRFLALCGAGMLMLFALSPLVLANPEQEPSRSSRPLEMVLEQNGTWHAEAWTLDRHTSLIVGYTGAYESMAPSAFGTAQLPQVTLSDTAAVTGIYLPYAAQATGDVRVALVGVEEGVSHGPFTLEANPVGDAQVGAAGDSLESMTFDQPHWLYSLQLSPGILLEAGTYTLEISDAAQQVRTDQTGPSGAFLVKGLSESAFETYQQDIVQMGSEESDFTGEAEGDTDVEETVDQSPVAFETDDEYILDEITLNTWNQGAGAEPGIISLLDDTMEPIEHYEAQGETFRDVANGLWTVGPHLLLPPGNYYVTASDPAVLQYDSQGVPEFSLALRSPQEEGRGDFSGTYLIDLDAFRLSTLMGAEAGDTSAFSVRNFEAVVIDQGSELEIVGRYEGVPFSQRLIVIEEGPDYVVASFDFDADLSNLPAHTRITAQGQVTLQEKENQAITIDIDGRAVYQRSASSERGADYNTYRVSGTGRMKNTSMPPFVMTALGRGGGGGSAGSFPGPANATQAATGLLFPPLAGLVANVATERMRSKEKPDEPEKYTYDYFKRKYPHMSDHMIAMQILSVSRPDPDSMFDRERTPDPDRKTAEELNQIQAEKTQKERERLREAREKEAAMEEARYGESQTEEEQIREKPQETEQAGVQDQKVELDAQQEPTATDFSHMEQTIQIPDPRGVLYDYELNPNDGEYYNVLNGSKLDWNHLRRDILPQIEKNRQFNAQQRHNLATGNTLHDREVRAGEARRQEELRNLEYLDRMANQYGTRDRYEIRRIQRQDQFRGEDQFEGQMRYGDRLQTAENTARVVDKTADTAIEGLARVTGPAGRGIRAGYQVTREVGSTMAEDGVSVNSLAAGTARGGATAATNYTGSGTRSRIANAALEVAGDTAGGAIQGGKEGARRALVDSSIEQSVNVVRGEVTERVGNFAADQTDSFRGGYGNETVTTEIGRGQTRVAVRSGDQWVSRDLKTETANRFLDKKTRSEAVASSVNYVSNMTNEFAVKPGVSNLQDSAKETLGIEKS